MPSPHSYSNWVISLLNVTGSTVSGPHNAVLMGGDSGIEGFGDGGEVSQDAEAYGAPGIVFRPRPPESVTTPDGTVTVGAESVAARVGDELVPVGWRDLRWNRAFPSPSAGSIAFVGYGGGFLSLDDVAIDDKADPSNYNPTNCSIEVMYCPYYPENGATTKAHSVILDPDDESVTVVHGEGQSILMQNDGTIRLQSPDGQTYIQIEDGKVSIQADQIVLNGGAVVVGNPLGAIVPLTAGAASPPCPRLFLNPAA